jgi:hypothetical protein
MRQRGFTYWAGCWPLRCWFGPAQYIQAIGSYYEGSPGSVKAYPKALQDLVEDWRSPSRDG